MSLSEHLAAQTKALPPGQAAGVTSILEAIARVAILIEQELAHAAVRGRLGAAGGTERHGRRGEEARRLGPRDDGGGAPRDAGACAALRLGGGRPSRSRWPGGTRRASWSAAIRSTARRTWTSTAAWARSSRSAPPRRARPPAPAALGPVDDQLAAGYVLYGPATTLVYTMGHGHARLHPRSRSRRVPAHASRHPRAPARQDLRHQRGQRPARGIPASAPSSST